MLKTLCHRDVLKSVYYALISSKIEYGMEIWGGAYYTTLKPIITLQKCFIRLVSNKTRLQHTEPLFKDLNILPFRNLYIFKVLNIFFCKSGEDRQNFGLRGRARTLRRCADVSVPKPNLTAYKHFFSFLAPKFFNNLPEEIKLCNNKKTYSKLVKNILLSNPSSIADRFYLTVVYT